VKAEQAKKEEHHDPNAKVDLTRFKIEELLALEPK
jgi:hypothetical protein